MTTALATLTSNLAQKFNMGDGTGLKDILKATAFKLSEGKQVSDDQMAALMVVADQYGLNPFTREIFAFPDKGGIVPVVGVDGWSRIINTHPQFDGMEFQQDEQSCTCIIYRKDRSHSISVTEYMSECKRDNVQPWKSHPRRMLRHKAMIQCARLAFGFAGIYDPDEAERIVEINGAIIDGGTGEVLNKKPTELPAYSDADLDKNMPAWQKAINTDKATPQAIVNKLSTKFKLSDDQTKIIMGMVKEQPKEEKRDPVTIDNDAPAIDEKDIPFN